MNKEGSEAVTRGCSLKRLNTLAFGIDRTPRLLIIPFFVTLPNLIQHYSFINFGEFLPFFQTPRLLIHVHSGQRYREA